MHALAAPDAHVLRAWADLLHHLCTSLHIIFSDVIKALQGLDVERGHGHLPMEEGRPDIEHILQDMLNQSKASEVSVHSAGGCKQMLCHLDAATHRHMAGL